MVVPSFSQSILPDHARCVHRTDTDNSNQLIWVEKRASDAGTLQTRVDFKYDAFGQRIEKKVDSNGDGTPDTTLRFAYDGENVFADFDGGTPPSLTTRYLRGDVIDQIFARIGAPGMAGELNWLLTDRLGSVHNVLGASGTILATLVYDGFGNLTTESDPSKTGRYTWTGRERDVEIDLQYNRARYYDPATGRWIHRDPLGFDAGDSNLYRYVNNGPTNGTDPSGLQPPIYDASGNRVWPKSYYDLPKEASPAKKESFIDKKGAPPTSGSSGLVWKQVPDSNSKAGYKLVPELYRGPKVDKFKAVSQPPTEDLLKALNDQNPMVGFNRKTDLIGEMFWPRKTAHLDPAVRFNLHAQLFVIEFRTELRALGKLLSIAGSGLQIAAGLYNIYNPLGWYLIYRGVEGLYSEFSGEERWSTQLGRYLGGDTGANIAEYGFMAADLAAAWRLMRVPSTGNGAQGLGNAPQGMTGAAYLTSPERVARYEALLQRAVANGRTGEAVGELSTRIEMMRRGYLRVGEGIYDKSGHGIDAVYRHVQTGEIAVVESKFNAGFNANRNAETLLGEGHGFPQMSTEWIDINIKNASKSSFPSAQRVGAFLEANGYDHRIIVVTNQKGEAFVHFMK